MFRMTSLPNITTSATYSRCQAWERDLGSYIWKRLLVGNLCWLETRMALRMRWSTVSLVCWLTRKIRLKLRLRSRACCAASIHTRYFSTPSGCANGLLNYSALKRSNTPSLICWSRFSDAMKRAPCRRLTSALALRERSSESMRILNGVFLNKVSRAVLRKADASLGRLYPIQKTLDRMALRP